MTEPTVKCVPRSVLLSKSARTAPILSPCGGYIAWIAPHNGAQNIWLAACDDLARARPLTSETVSAIREIWWAGARGMLIVTKDATGSEQTESSSFNVATGGWRLLSPAPGAQCRLVAISTKVPDEILLESNGRDPAFFDAWRVNIHTGAARIVLQNDRFTWLHADSSLRIRLAEQRNADDGSVTFHVSREHDEWRPLVEVPAEDEALTRPLRIYETLNAFGPDDTEIYARDSRGRNTAALVAWNLTTGAVRLIGADQQADAAAAVIDESSRQVLAWLSEYDKPSLHVMPDAKGDFARLSEKLDGNLWISNQSPDSRRWVVARHSPSHATDYYLFDWSTGKVSHLFSERPELGSLALATTSSHLVRSRDGLDLVCYVTRPADAPPGPRPLVVLIHGGPWIRDSLTFEPWIQLLANRGYAVLTVNFRGSGGFGKAFLNAGDREWGGAMLDDVLDATRWAIEAGIADSESVAAMGASFGGYSVLAAMTREPELFACGIDIFGVSDLESFLASIPPHWKILKNLWAQRVGDVDSVVGRAFLRSRSPLHSAGKIKRPMLIVQGGADPRVKEQESRQMVAVLDANGVEVTYVLFPNEGHNFFQLANELTFFACVEGFLAKHLGGRAEPFGEEITQADVVVPVGAGHVPGLASRASVTHG